MTAVAVESVSDLVLQILSASKKIKRLRVLDLCTGTGCCSLLLHKLLKPHVEDLHILGIDKSPRALSVARLNKSLYFRTNPSASNDIEFQLADVFRWTVESPSLKDQILSTADKSRVPTWDIVIANPPYVSKSTYFSSTTERSVRGYEPRMALMFTSSCTSEFRTITKFHSGDEFYEPIMAIANSAQAQILLIEVGSKSQAERVARLALSSHQWDAIKIMGADGKITVDAIKAETEAAKSYCKTSQTSFNDDFASSIVCLRNLRGNQPLI